MHEKENIPKTFICKNTFAFVLQEMKSIKDTLSLTEIKKTMSDILSPTETKKIMSDTLSSTKIRIRFMQRNETFEKGLQSLYVLEKILVCDTNIICSMRMKTLCVKIPFTNKLLFNNSNHTHLNPYKRDSFHTHPSSYKNSSFHTSIEKHETMETLAFDRTIERTKKRKLPSPTEVEESMRKPLSPTKMEIRNSRAFFFPNTILKKLREYNLEGVIETIQKMRCQNLLNNVQVIQDFRRHILSNPVQFPKISATHVSYYFPNNQQIECPKILDTCCDHPNSLLYCS
ncbi:hypothetical protein CFOL_v3_30176 [Cephalotus follicularis]|uniref:Uncharacterized protein n=1 Tax=Cephalotus follicularis TaxID=3775 RepID=A0A1Q3D2P1_CEPFO|nr:hypothetical protein CFOL_v3_30176 [Cephalotus follicularis]